jgi:hypothetical protein
MLCALRSPCRASPGRRFLWIESRPAFRSRDCQVTPVVKAPLLYDGSNTMSHAKEQLEIVSTKEFNIIRHYFLSGMIFSNCI